MKMPWEGRSGLARWIAIYATLLLVSSGLCGANAGLWSLLDSASKANPYSIADWAGILLMITGFVEWLGIIVGAGGLIILTLIALFFWIANKLSPTKDRKEYRK
jgi:hypothetical protein